MDYQQETDFDFSWWLSMTPAILMAIYFVCRWNDHRTEVLDLVAAVASVVIGVVITAVICNPACKPEPKAATAPEVTPASPLECQPILTKTDPNYVVEAPYSEKIEAMILEHIEPRSSEHAEPIAPKHTEHIPLTTTEPEKLEALAQDEPSRTALAQSLEASITDSIEAQFHAGAHVATVAEDSCMAPDSTPTDPLSIAPRTAVPSSAELGPWFSKGLTLMKSRNFRDALYCFSYILQRDQSHVPSLNAKAKCLIELKRYDEALRLYMQAVRIDASDAIAQEGIVFANKQLQEARLH